MIRINKTLLFIGCLFIGALFSFGLQDAPKSPKVKPEEAYIPPGFIYTGTIIITAYGINVEEGITK